MRTRTRARARPEVATVPSPTVVVVMGVAGAGKTTVGQALAEAMGWSFFDADDFHAPESVARMRAGLPLDDARRAPWLAELRALIASTLQAGESAVLACSALRHAYRDALVPRDVVTATGGRVRFVHLRVSPGVLAARLGTRTGHFAPPALLTSQLATLEEPAAGEPALLLDGELPVPELVATIRAQLQSSSTGS